VAANETLYDVANSKATSGNLTSDKEDALSENQLDCVYLTLAAITTLKMKPLESLSPLCGKLFHLLTPHSLSQSIMFCHFFQCSTMFTR
jgi:hypothetical protein